MSHSESGKESVFIIPPSKTFEDGTIAAKKYIRFMLKSSGLLLTEAAKLLNAQFPEDKTTTQNISNKIARGSLRDYEIAQLAEICGFQLQLVKVGTSDKPQETKKAKRETISDSVSYAETYKPILRTIATVNSKNFGSFVFVGKYAIKAESHYLQSVGIESVDAETELELLKRICKQCKVEIKTLPQLLNQD